MFNHCTLLLPRAHLRNLHVILQIAAVRKTSKFEEEIREEQEEKKKEEEEKKRRQQAFKDRAALFSNGTKATPAAPATKA